MDIKFFTFLLFIALTGCNNQKIDTKAEEEKIKQTAVEWSKVEGNKEKMLTYWADDAVMMVPGQPTIKGKEAIRKMLDESYKIPGFKVTWNQPPLSVHVSKSGDLAYSFFQGQMTMNDSLGNPITIYNKAVVIWRKEPDGSWKDIVDVINSDPSQKK
jgi:ketosteroid isomerase-like protein